MIKQRPLSPHLQIYKPQLTSVLSIVHRLSGIFLCLVYVVLCGWICMVSFAPQVAAYYSQCKCWIVTSFTYGLWILGITALVYHWLNGIRHLLWDSGVGLEISSVERSAKVVLALTALSFVFSGLWVTGRIAL